MADRIKNEPNERGEQHMDQKGFYLDIMSVDGKMDWFGAGLINGLNWIDVETVLIQIEKDSGDMFEFPESGFFQTQYYITNISQDPGQMTFPETGQWDFAPYTDFESTVISVQRLEE